MVGTTTPRVVAPRARASLDAHAATRPNALPTVVSLTVWVALIAVAVVWGEHVVAVGDRLRIHAPPLSGDYRTRAGWALLAPIAVGIAVAVMGPRGARTLRWDVLLAVSMCVAVIWAIALGLNDGWSGLVDPLGPGQYLRTVPRVADPLTFLDTFTDRIATYNIHTQGHPPGMVLVLWGLDRIGLGGAGPNLALVLGGGASSVAAALVAARELAGETAARAAAPFLVVAPAAIWWSSGDAFFAGVAAWAVACVVLATGRTGGRAHLLAAAGGALFGVAALLSYGLVLLALIPVTVAVARRRVGPILVAGSAGSVLLLALLPFGFSWIAGLAATHGRYWAGVASRRPYSYFLVGDLAAFALALGPAVAVALARLRDARLWLLVGGASAAVAVADVSGMSKAEVERIWLPFAPWILLATAALAGRGARERSWGPSIRVWLLAQAGVAVVIQTAVRSPW